MSTLSTTPAVALRRRRARRAASIVVLGGTLFATLGFWLATSNSVQPSISPAGGLSSGAIATVASMDAQATGAGNGNSLSGIAIERIRVAESFTSSSRVSVAWLDPGDASKVLNNPNAQLSFTLYHPVAISSTDNSSCSSFNDSSMVEIEDAQSPATTTYCALPDTAATGSSTVSSGSLFLSKSLLAGYLLPSITASGSDPCLSTTTTGSTWCQIPSGTPDGAGGYDGTAQRTIWLVATINTPGNAPKGQQAQAGSLEFYVKVTSS